MQLVPNPNPAFVAVQLDGPADEVVLRIYSAAETCLAVVSSGPSSSGWMQVALPKAWSNGVANGVYYLRVEARRGTIRTMPVKPARAYLVR